MRSTSFGGTVDVLARLGAADDLVAVSLPLSSTRRVRLGDQLLLLLRGVEVDDLVGDHAVADDPVRAS